MHSKISYNWLVNRILGHFSCMPCSLVAVRDNLAIDSIVGFLVDYVC